MLFLSFLAVSVYAEFSMQLIYQERYYNLTICETASLAVNKYVVVSAIDRTQIHRIMLSSVEKSRLLSLLYVGDSYSFNQVKLTKISTDLYRIEDLENKFGISFSYGEYDDIILYSYINFCSADHRLYTEVDDMDKIASGVSVKILLSKIHGSYAPKTDLPLTITAQEMDYLKTYSDDETEMVIIYNAYPKRGDGTYYLRQDLVPDEEIVLRQTLDRLHFSFSKTFAYKDKVDAYERFITQLRSYGTPEQIFDKLREFVTINFRVIDDYSMTTDWVNPYELYYSKKGDYKSIAFFYYETFTELNLDCEAFFVAPLTKKSMPDQKPLSRDENDAQLLLHGINPSSNLDLTAYNLPEYTKAVLLVAVKYDNRWIYTTGKKWVYTDIVKKERVTAHYSKNGCYYSVLRDSQLIIENIPLNPKKLHWEVFFDISKNAE